MSECDIFLDNDVMIKVCCYALAHEVCEHIRNSGGVVAAPVVTRMVVKKQISRKKIITNRGAAEQQFDMLSGVVKFVEPSPDEIEFAAELESEAQVLDLALDPGESQILAILMLRSAKLMITGDKRALAAIDKILLKRGDINRCREKVACFEQLMMGLLIRYGMNHVRARVCCERDADQAISICFSCNSGVAQVDRVKEGLCSYIKNVKNDAPNILWANENVLFKSFRRKTAKGDFSLATSPIFISNPPASDGIAGESSISRHALSTCP